eukprot:GHVP01020475.1.p1 GENE.GHVP01020475.1~~GHVP01020475.1.p1  ORF type:complete len:106 (+),score=5.74 GHVP01020475.1:286-603(+)
MPQSDNGLTQTRYQFTLRQSSNPKAPTLAKFPKGYEIVICKPGRHIQDYIYGRDLSHPTTFYRVQPASVKKLKDGLEEKFKPSDDLSDLEVLGDPSDDSSDDPSD